MLPYIDSILYFAASFVVLLILGLHLYKQNKDASLNYIISYLLFGLIADLFLNAYLEGAFNYASLGPRIFTVIEFALLSLFIHNKIKSKKIKQIMVPLSALFIFVCVYDLKSSDRNDLDSISIGTSSVIILFYLIFFLFEKINQNEEFFIYSKIDFWLVAGLVMYSSGTFFTLVSSQNKFTEDDYRSTYNLIMSSFALFRNILFLIGFILLPVKEK